MSKVSRRVTRKKVQGFLQGLKAGTETRDITNLVNEARAWNLNGSAYCVMLRAMEIVKKDSPRGAYEWNPAFGEPDAELVETLIDLTSEYQNA